MGVLSITPCPASTRSASGRVAIGAKLRGTYWGALYGRQALTCAFKLFAHGVSFPRSQWPSSQGFVRMNDKAAGRAATLETIEGGLHVSYHK